MSNAVLWQHVFQVVECVPSAVQRATQVARCTAPSNPLLVVQDIIMLTVIVPASKSLIHILL